MNTIHTVNKHTSVKQIYKIKPVPGRLELVARKNNNSNIVIDFAHTPDALEQSLIAIQKQFKKEIILVFGCGGDRDREKRPKMANVATLLSAQVILTSDNPRTEDPEKIFSLIPFSFFEEFFNDFNKFNTLNNSILIDINQFKFFSNSCSNFNCFHTKKFTFN